MQQPEARVANENTDNNIANHLGNLEFLEYPCANNAAGYTDSKYGENAKVYFMHYSTPR